MAKLQANKIHIILKLLAVSSVGFFLWKYAASGLQLAADSFAIDAVWSVVSSRLALLGYILPFLIWRHLEPQSRFGFYLGDIGSSIKMPFIFCGFKDSVLRVAAVFSTVCLVLAGVLFFVRQLSIQILLAGIAFAVLNSVLEEFLWRGLILSRTTQLGGEKLGLIVMSLAFGLYHYPLGFSIPVCLLFSLGGIYFGGIALHSKGLVLGTAMHISMNMLFVSIGIIF